jgi:DNA repair protein RadD
VIDECHRVNNAGTGQYRQFLSELARYCTFRCVGYTATEYRGDGSWLTSGAKPFFTGIACKVKMRELLDAGYLSPLVVPAQAVKTKISTSGVRTTNGDYNIGELSGAVGVDLHKVADEAVILATDRKKWIAFTPAVSNAEAFVELLNERGIHAAVVCGETPADVRADRIAAFRRGELRCLVTVLALAVGFDVPDIDCIVWVRPTKSPVLYVQGAGRGLRIAEGKTDCLWLDFTSTTSEHGPIDKVTGRQKGGSQDLGAPVKHCPECGTPVAIAVMTCPACGTEFPPPPKKGAELSFAPVLSGAKPVRYEISNVSFWVHKKLGSPDSVRVDYRRWSGGMGVLASEWVCFEHQGYARKKAEKWWRERMGDGIECPATSKDAEKLDRVIDWSPLTVVLKSNKA